MLSCFDSSQHVENGIMFKLTRILNCVEMFALLDKFMQQNVTKHDIYSLNDGESSQLGVTTIGERIRIKEAEKRANQVGTDF